MTLATPPSRLRALAASALLLLCATASLAQTPVPGFLNGDCEVTDMTSPNYGWTMYNGIGRCGDYADYTFGEFPQRSGSGGMGGYYWNPLWGTEYQNTVIFHPTRKSRRLTTQTVVLSDGSLDGKLFRFSTWATGGHFAYGTNEYAGQMGVLEITFLDAGGTPLALTTSAPIDLSMRAPDYKRSEVSAVAPSGTRQIVVVTADSSYENQIYLDDWELTYEENPLPVELTSFAAVADGAAARLRWTTESETNNAGFSVETLRGATWQEVAFVSGRGTTSEQTRYERRIEGLSAGTHTFRLVQRDLDGTATMAGTVEVVITSGGRLSIYPSPARTSVRIEGLTTATDVVDALGRVVARAVPGETLSVSSWAPGVYVVMAAEPQRFVVAR